MVGGVLGILSKSGCVLGGGSGVWGAGMRVVSCGCQGVVDAW